MHHHVERPCAAVVDQSAHRGEESVLENGMVRSRSHGANHIQFSFLQPIAPTLDDVAHYYTVLYVSVVVADFVDCTLAIGTTNEMRSDLSRC